MMSIRSIEKNKDDKVLCVSCTAAGVDTVAEFKVSFMNVDVEIPLCGNCLNSMVSEEEELMDFGDEEC